MWLCSIPTLVVIFSGSFLGIVSDEYTVFLGIKVVHWLTSWHEMHSIQVQVSGLLECWVICFWKSIKIRPQRAGKEVSFNVSYAKHPNYLALKYHIHTHTLMSCFRHGKKTILEGTARENCYPLVSSCGWNLWARWVVNSLIVVHMANEVQEGDEGTRLRVCYVCSSYALCCS